MAGSSPHIPEVRFRAPTFRAEDSDIEAGQGVGRTEDDAEVLTGSHGLKQPFASRLSSKDDRPHARSPTPTNTYLGSYTHATPRGSVADLEASYQTPPSSPRASVSRLHLEALLPLEDLNLEQYGIEEFRDGFFDASFYQPIKRRPSDLTRHAIKTLPQCFEKKDPLSRRHFLTQQLREIRGFLNHVRTRSGIKLLRSFLGVFIAYIICLIPSVRDWLGRYNYILVFSAILNHPGRPVGSQLDGAMLTIIGTIAGLGWGSLALYVSTSTEGAKTGYGGVLATFMVVFTAAVGFIRCIFLRFYQAVVAAGVAICYTCLANTSEHVSWGKLFDYGIPFVLGQALCLTVAVTVLPTAGARSFGVAMHDCLGIIEYSLRLPRKPSRALKRDLATEFVKLSTAVRDLTLEYTLSRFRGEDVLSLRNLTQGVIRSILSIQPNTTLFDHAFLELHEGGADIIHQVQQCLSGPTHSMLLAMQACISSADKSLLQMAGLSSSRLSKVAPIDDALAKLTTAMQLFDQADGLVLENEDISTAYKDDMTAIEIFLFVHPLRQAAKKVEDLARHISQMQTTCRHWRIRAPSYPWHKAIVRSNAQVRHDRGGLTAGFYFRSKDQLEQTMSELQGREYLPAARKREGEPSNGGIPSAQKHGNGAEARGNRSKRESFRYYLWSTVHRLQGFETRFALKVTVVTTLLSIPAWLNQSRDWWNNYESWWAVVAVWLTMNPRVGGTVHDLFIRCTCAIIGATWGGLAYRAGNGNPYVMAVFAAILLVPMLHRFTQSSHPRSGLSGCVTFAVISLDRYSAVRKTSTVTLAWTRGLAFVVGIIASVVVNWILWPFIARHELRKSLSSMMLHSAILYRGVIARYVYYAEGEQPGPKDIERSEVLEGRVREGFVRLRQLLELTRHETRLRAPFDPLPYSALLASLEAFFGHLIEIRQSSLYFQTPTLTPDPTQQSAQEALTAARRDAVAVVLMNLYILASALRADQPAPRYLPSAAVARKKLLDRMESVEAENRARRMAEEAQGGLDEAVTNGTAGGEDGRKKRRWADVYHYAYSSALTDIVEELQIMGRYTKEICGEG